MHERWQAASAGSGQLMTRYVILGSSMTALLAALGPLGVGPPSARSAVSGDNGFASPPVVLYAEVRPAGNYQFAVVFRTKHALPHRGTSVRASVRVGTVGSPLPLGRLSKKRSCYVQSLEPADGSPLARPRHGKVVTVEVALQDGSKRRFSTRVPMRLTSRDNVANPGPRTVARAGCPGERPG